jgi:dienelactone hydrolase
MAQNIRWAGAALMATVAVLISAGLSAGPASAESAALTTSPVTFIGDGGTLLHGTIVAPASAEGERPGLVLVGGAGPDRGAGHLEEADAFARGGVVSLVYDKRTVGYSTFARSYTALAQDALAAIEVLRARRGVDPSRVGLWGFSEGGWVAPLAAAQSADVAFVMTVGASGGSPARQQAWSDRVFLRHGGVSGSLLRAYADTTVRLLVDAGLFAEAGYDPAPSWEHVRQPVLALWGMDDQVAGPYEESSAMIRGALERGGNRHYTIRFFPRARHDLHVTYDQGFDSGTYAGYVRRNPLAPGYASLVTSWIGGLAEGPPGASADPVPRPSRTSAELAPSSWYESARAQLAVYALFLVAFAGHTVIAAVRQVSGRPLQQRVRRPARLLAATGLSAVIGPLLYLSFLLGTGAGIVVPVGPVVAGGPLPWLALQLLAAGVVVATVAAAVRSWQARHDLSAAGRAQVGVLLAGGVAFVPWAMYWGLLRP